MNEGITDEIQNILVSIAVALSAVVLLPFLIVGVALIETLRGLGIIKNPEAPHNPVELR